jgi:hypothetical protein
MSPAPAAQPEAAAISMARAVDDPDLSRQILTNAANALKQCISN